MQERETTVGDETVPLTATNVQSITVPSDRAKLIQEFVNSQRMYMSRYSTEGRPAAAAWDEALPAAGGNTPTRKDPPREILALAFDTPILKPRVPIAQGPGLDASPVDEIEGSSGVVKASRATAQGPISTTVTKSKRVVRTKSHKENVLEPGAKSPPKRTGRHDINAVSMRADKQTTLNRYASTTNIKVKTKPSGRKRPRSPDPTDSECVARLTERREKRRVKRDIVAPKASIISVNVEEVDCTSGRPDVRKGKKKKESASLAAGLALMHGFTAKNIGKNRLTAQPERRNGVFNKGKASANVGTGAKRHAVSAVFSEHQFLNKIKRGPSPGVESSSEMSSKSSSCSTSSDLMDEPARLHLMRNLMTSKTNNSKNKQPPQDRHSHEVSGGNQQSESSAVPSQSGDKRAASPVWHIEIDGNSLPSGSESAREDQAENDTVILNTQSKKWVEITAKPTRSLSFAELVQKEEQASLCEEAPRSHLDPGTSVDRTSTLSLRPSESASQLPPCLVSSVPQPNVSRFFAPLPIVPSAHDDTQWTFAMEDGPLPSAPHLPVDSRPASTKSHECIMEQRWPSASNFAMTQHITDHLPSNMHPRTTLSHATASMSALDRELQALDDNDLGILYAVHRNEGFHARHAQHGQFSVLSRSRTEVLDPLLQAHESARFPGDIELGSERYDQAFSDPGASEWDGQSCCSLPQEEHTDYVMDDATGAVAEFIDDEGQYDSWWECVTVDDAALVPELQIDPEVTYVDGETVEDAPGFPPTLDGPPDTYEYEAHRTRSQMWATYAESLDSFKADSRPQTASSWCSVIQEPAAACSPSAVASELSAELVSHFAQGRDLLLGLSGHSGERKPYSITSVEEDVARSLRGHWLPQRL